jgi:hypothetical protein
VKIAAAATIVLLLAGVFVFRKHEGADAAGAVGAERVQACLRAAGKPSSIETSSTGQRQVAIAHGPVQISANVTFQNSTTYISFMRSADEAAWWVDQLRPSPDIPDDSVVSSGNAFVHYGAGATTAERAAVSSCLS